MFRIKIKRHSDKVFHDIVEIEDQDKAHYEYCKLMDCDIFYCSLNKVVDGKEQNIASFCKSEFAEPRKGNGNV